MSRVVLNTLTKSSPILYFCKPPTDSINMCTFCHRLHPRPATLLNCKGIGPSADEMRQESAMANCLWELGMKNTEIRMLRAETGVCSLEDMFGTLSCEGSRVLDSLGDDTKQRIRPSVGGCGSSAIVAKTQTGGKSTSGRNCWNPAS